MSSNCTETDSF